MMIKYQLHELKKNIFDVILPNRDKSDFEIILKVKRNITKSMYEVKNNCF